MRFRFFTRDCVNLDLCKAGLLQEAVQRAFLEAEPDIGVELTGLFEGMLIKVKNQDLATRFQNTVRFVDGRLWMLGVMQRLGKYGEIH